MFNIIKKHKTACIALASMLFMAADCVMSVEKIELPANAKVNTQETVTVQVKLTPSSDDVTKFAFAVLAPKSWNLKENATLSLSTSGYAAQGFDEVINEPLTLIPDSEKEPSSQLTWSMAYQSKIGLMGNTGPVEWTVFKSSTEFHIDDKVSADPIIGTVTMKIKTGADNIKFFLGVGYCGTHRGLMTESENSGDFRYVPNEKTAVWEITGADGPSYDYTVKSSVTTTPSVFRYGDIFSVNFTSKGSALDGTSEAWLCGTVTLADGTEKTVDAVSDASKMEDIGESTFRKYIYPRQFFGLAHDAQIESLKVWFVNADKSVKVDNDGAGFNLAQSSK